MDVPSCLSDLPPGSKAAQRRGCRCPVHRNRFGQGAGFMPGTTIATYFVEADCPLHRDWMERLAAVLGDEGMARWRNLRRREAAHQAAMKAAREVPQKRPTGLFGRLGGLFRPRVPS